MKKSIVNPKLPKEVSKWYKRIGKKAHTDMAAGDPIAYSERQAEAVRARWKKYYAKHPKPGMA